MRFDGPRHTYPATNAIVQSEAAERAGLVGHTDVNGDAFKIPKAHQSKLEGFARRLRLFGRTQGTTTIATTSYEIQVGVHDFKVLAVNGKPLEEA